MFDPQASSQSPRSSRIAMPIALLLASTFGLGIAIIEPSVVLKKTNAAQQVKQEQITTLEAPKQAMPEVQLPPPNAQELVKFCSSHVTTTRSFVVFQNGTCVLVQEPCQDPIKAAKEILSGGYNEEAKFVTEMSAEGDMIVAFETAVFHRYGATELSTLHDWMKHEKLSFLTQKEVLAAGEGWTPPANAQIGLLARRRMLDDSLNAIPIKVIRAKERSVATR